MTIYSVYTRDRAHTGTESRAVPDRFIWSAALFTPVWALVHGLWVAFIAWLAFAIALVVASDFIGGDAAFWVYVLASVLIGFEAPSLRRASLANGGWRYRGEAAAGSADVAEAECLRRLDNKRGWA